MASLHDVLKEVLERDFDEKDVDKIVNPEEDITENDRTRSEAESEQDDPGDSYAGSGDFVQNSVGRGAVESFIKNSVYEKYNIDASSVSSFARMTPTEMLSDFGKSVRDLGTIRSDYHAGKMTASEYKSAVNHKARAEIKPVIAKCSQSNSRDPGHDHAYGLIEDRCFVFASFNKFHIVEHFCGPCYL